MKEINHILQELRIDRDLRQKDLANYLGIAQQTYSNYETGTREIPIPILIQLIQFDQVSADYLLGIPPKFPGSSDMTRQYVDGISMNHLILEAQSLTRTNRRDLVRYIAFLKMHNQLK